MEGETQRLSRWLSAGHDVGCTEGVERSPPSEPAPVFSPAMGERNTPRCAFDHGGRERPVTGGWSAQ
jgi:hypothetical protein